jgi:Amt family ammonium transporter
MLGQFRGVRVAVGAVSFLPGLVHAADPASPRIDSGNTAWLIAATALVLFMTLPGLALFYGGLVRGKNVLSVLVQCFVITCLVSILWLVAGYGLAFGDGGAAQPWIGGFG